MDKPASNRKTGNENTRLCGAEINDIHPLIVLHFIEVINMTDTSSYIHDLKVRNDTLQKQLKELFVVVDACINGGPVTQTTYLLAREWYYNDDDYLWRHIGYKNGRVGYIRGPAMMVEVKRMLESLREVAVIGMSEK